MADDRPSDTQPAAANTSHVEAELAFQGDALRELSDALAAQQLDILAMKTQIEHLSAQIKALRQELGAADAGSENADEPPPHY